MPEFGSFGWRMKSKTEAEAADEWHLMVSRCVARLGKPPTSVLAGKVAAILLARVVPQGCALRVAIQMQPLDVHMGVGE